MTVANFAENVLIFQLPTGDMLPSAAGVTYGSNH